MARARVCARLVGVSPNVGRMLQCRLQRRAAAASSELVLWDGETGALSFGAASGLEALLTLPAAERVLGARLDRLAAAQASAAGTACVACRDAVWQHFAALLACEAHERQAGPSSPSNRVLVLQRALLTP